MFFLFVVIKVQFYCSQYKCLGGIHQLILCHVYLWNLFMTIQENLRPFAARSQKDVDNPVYLKAWCIPY